MRIRVTNPSDVDGLVAFLTQRVHVIAARVDEREVEVSQLGSMNEQARRLDLEQLLETWTGGRAEIVVPPEA